MRDSDSDKNWLDNSKKLYPNIMNHYQKAYFPVEFQGDKLSVAKLEVREPGVYTNVVSEVIPSSGSADGRHFWLYYRYDASAAVIQVGLDQNTPEYVDHSPPQETTYLGTFSNDAAEWKIRHYLKT